VRRYRFIFAMPAMTSAITRATPDDLMRLLEVWETAVRATHDFLARGEIGRLRPLVLQALALSPDVFCLRDEAGDAYAFLGMDGDEIAMLFVHAGHRGQGAGRLLVRHAIDALGARRVDVNEQNAQGVGFYRAMGFVPVGRSPVDGQGSPYPLLHMALPD